MKIKTIIVDDEPRAHKVLETYIQKNTELELVGEFLNAVSAYEFLKNNKVDLILLDITMPSIDGFALVRMLSPSPLIVFTTAHPEFALESYDYNAVDYLKKPISPERFSKAISKVSNLLTNRNPPKSFPEFLDLKIDGVIRRFQLSEICYFQSLGNYIKVITDDKRYLTQITTKEIEESLPKELFIRIHKSYIVNKARIEKVTEEEVILGALKLPIGKTFKKYVKDSTSSTD